MLEGKEESTLCVKQKNYNKLGAFAGNKLKFKAL